MIKRELTIYNRLDFTKFLDAISKISESAIINISDNVLSSLVASEDNTLILSSEISGIDSNFNGTINVPDLKKLVRVLDSLQSTSISLIINTNNIEYKGGGVKFKYHLYEDGFLTKPSINVEKIKKFEYDIKFDITKIQIQSIIRGSAFATETNKLYLYTEDGELKAELTDRARHNTDEFGMSLGEVDFELKSLPLNFDNIKLLTVASDTVNVGINTQYGVSVFDIVNNDIKLKYIVTSLTQ